MKGRLKNDFRRPFVWNGKIDNNLFLFCEQFYNTDIDSEGLYIFEGYYLKKKNGEYKFSGETRKIDCRSLLRHER